MRLEFLKFDEDSDPRVFLVLGTISAGVPSDITGEIVQVKLIEHLMEGHKKGVFIIRVHGESMAEEIEDGDVIVVSQNVSPEIGKRIVASVNGEYTLKRFGQKGKKPRLIASNKKFAPREIFENDNFEVFGVVTHVIKKI